MKMLSLCVSLYASLQILQRSSFISFDVQIKNPSLAVTHLLDIPGFIAELIFCSWGTLNHFSF